jgi:AraC-like DNA-binding protein
MARKTTIPVHSITDRTPTGLEIRRITTTSYDVDVPLRAAHRDDHYIFVFQESGNSSFMVDFEEVTVKDANLFCILPGQVHQAITAFEVEGWLIAADSSWVSDSYRSVFASSISSLRPVALDTGKVTVLKDAIQLFMNVFYHQGGSSFSAQIIRHLADAYIGMFASAYSDRDKAGDLSNSRPHAITRQFKALLSASYKSVKSPAAYAATLNISPSYLNESVKQITGFPVSYWIHNEIILEARRMLYYTDVTVKEISNALGYEDQAYFTRLFTKTAGISPLLFRQQYRK